MPGLIPGHLLVETISVPAGGGVVRSTTALRAGVTYKLRASGTFPVSTFALGDAEYIFSPDKSFVMNHCPIGSSHVDIGISVNDAVPSPTRRPFWGPFNHAHEYTAEFVGAGAPIELNYHACHWDRNSGALKVEIFAESLP